MKYPLFQRDLVLIDFPFSKMTESKVRPVIVMSTDEYNNKFDDFIAIPLTSRLDDRDYAFLITNKEMESGRLKFDSRVKVDRIYNLEQKDVTKKFGKIKKEFHKKLRESLLQVI